TGGAAAAEAGAFTRLGSGGSSHAVCAQWGPGQGAWSAFLTDVARLLDQCRPCLDALPGELLQQLSSRAGRGLHGLWWNRAKSGAKTLLPDIDSERLELAEFPGPQRTSSSPSQPGGGLSATEQIAVTLRREMISSGFRPGDRLSVSLLAERLGLGQARVRNAMRQRAE